MRRSGVDSVGGEAGMMGEWMRGERPAMTRSDWPMASRPMATRKSSRWGPSGGRTSRDTSAPAVRSKPKEGRESRKSSRRMPLAGKGWISRAMEHGRWRRKGRGGLDMAGSLGGGWVGEAGQPKIHSEQLARREHGAG